MAESPDPRVARSREAIIAAARDLLVQEGPAAVTHQRVAKQAGVGRATVYRHWPQPGMLLGDAMAGVRMPFFLKPDSPVRPWLRRQTRLLADELALTEIRAVTAALVQGAVWEPGTADRRDQLGATIARQLCVALTLAEEAGELRPSGDVRDLPAQLIGPLFYRNLLESGTVSDDFIDRLLDALGTWAEP